MTTYQDPPPQSRRSARQSERGEQQAEAAAFTQFSGEQPRVDQTFIEQQPVVAPVQQGDAPVTGRRARASEPAQYDAPAEPLTYSTQGSEAVNYETQLPAAGYAPAPSEPAPFRVRDFSPEGGRRAAAPPLIEPQQTTAPLGGSDLEYRTEVAPSAAQPPVSQQPVTEPAVQQTLSRRELRLRQAEADAAANPAPQNLTPTPVASPAEVTQPPAVSTPAPTPAPLQAPTSTQTQAPELHMAPPPTLAPTPADAPTVAQHFQSAPPPQGPASTATTPPSATPPSATMTTPPAPLGPPSTLTAPPAQSTAPPTALSSAMAEFEQLTRSAQPSQPVVDAPAADSATPTFIEPTVDNAATSWVAPIGHWSRQADLDDETQPWENTITREVGVGNVATTTSALVLPEIPRASNFSTALDSTGEVLLTGSIDLPQSLSAGSGDPRRYDDANVDLMYDTQDAEFTGTDSMPVRAVRAVSTHTSSRGVIHSNRPRGNRMIVVVFITTAVLAVGVVGLFVASLVLNVF